jgi:hypothetical protein
MINPSTKMNYLYVLLYIKRENQWIQYTLLKCCHCIERKLQFYEFTFLIDQIILNERLLVEH